MLIYNLSILDLIEPQHSSVERFLCVWFSLCFFQVLALTAVSVGVAVATVTIFSFIFSVLALQLYQSKLIKYCGLIFINKTAGALLRKQCVSIDFSSTTYYLSILLFVAFEISFAHVFDRLMWKTTPITLFFLAMLILSPQGVLYFGWNNNMCSNWWFRCTGFLLRQSGALALGSVSFLTVLFVA